MANQLTIRVDAEDGIAVVSGSTVAGNGEVAVHDDSARGAIARRLALAVAAAAGSQVLAFPAAAQLSAACKVCGEECGTPIFYPEDGGCPNPIFYPESMIAIGAALVVGVLVGAWVARNRQNTNQ